MQGRARAVALAAAAAFAPGCGLMMNGVTTNVKVTSPTPGAQIYLNGAPLGALATVGMPASNFDHHVLLARAPGKVDKVLRLTPKVQVAPIILDVVAALPSLLIAPAIDGMMNMWFKIEPNEIGALALEDAKGIDRPAPEQTPGVEPHVAAEYAKTEVAGAAEYGKPEPTDKAEYGR